MDLADLLDRYNISYYAGKGSSSKSRDGWINLRCPYCGRDPYLGFCIAYRYFSCWNCGRHRTESTVARLLGIQWREACDLVDKLPREDFPDYFKEHNGYYIPPCGVEETIKEAHLRYIYSRGLDVAEVVKIWGVRGIGVYSDPHLKWRLFIPIHLRGECVSWTTRTITSHKEPRYISARDDQSKVPINDLVYGIDHIRNSCVLVEGPIDVWAIGPGAVACLGLYVSPARREQIARIPVKYICFDNEPDAQRRARKLCDDLSVHDGTITNIVLSTGKDPASADREEIKEIRELLL